MLKIFPIPAFDDNYIWAIHNTHELVVVDPGEAEPVLDFLKKEKLQLTAILITHHHGDHIGGNRELLKHFDIPVYGPAHEKISTVTHPLEEGEEVFLPQLPLKLQVMNIPGHTAGHIAYYGANHLFCGDTLFGCGCGRLFEGTPEQMHISLQKLAQLPDETEIYCAHEYTLANIRFAKAVEPLNSDIIRRFEHDQHLRNQGKPTLPSTISMEKLTNPFLRCTEPAVIAAASTYKKATIPDTVSVFAAIREWKNNFHQ